MIEVKEITKKYGKKKVLEGISFTAEKGEITCLIGINGVWENNDYEGNHGTHTYQ